MARIQQLRNELAAAHAHPDRDALESFQQLVGQWSLQHFSSMRSQSPAGGASRSELEQLLREKCPEEGDDFRAVLQQFSDKVAPNNYRVQHPRFFAFVPGAPTYLSILGDWLCSALNCYPSVWFEGAGSAQVELIVLDWFKEILDFPKQARGILTSGGSEATLTALVVARERLNPADWPRAVLYQSDQRHWSVDKAAKVIGLRPGQIRLIASDDDYRLQVNALAEVITADRNRGLAPCVVVANAGATNTGAVDPLDELADLCQRENVWLHVDAAYGWSAVLTEAGRTSLIGIERVDSITLDPHKWFAQTFEAGCILVREGKLLPQTFSSLPEYLQDVAPTEEEVNLSDYGITLTRRFRALKIWLSVKVLGLRWFRELADRSMKLAELTELLLVASGSFEMLSPRSLSIVCFRYRPREADLKEIDLNALNMAILEQLRRDGRFFLTSTRLRGRTALRCCFVNWRTTAADVEELVHAIEKIGNELYQPDA